MVLGRHHRRIGPAAWHLLAGISRRYHPATGAGPDSRDTIAHNVKNWLTRLSFEDYTPKSLAVFSDDEEERLARIEEMLTRLQRQRERLLRVSEKAKLEAKATARRVAAAKRKLRQARLKAEHTGKPSRPRHK
jgi:hypothetical protein